MALLYRYRFGTTVYDETTGELIVAGLPVELQTKPLQVLSLLLGARGEVVSREELLTAVWAGRSSIESNVLPNAVAKLRAALGTEAIAIETVARRGYRIVGTIEQTVVGRHVASALDLKCGDTVPSRNDAALERLLAQKDGQEVWLARRRDGERRVFKFASDADRIAGLRREARLSRLLTERLGPRDDIVPVVDWNFAAPPCFVEMAWGGVPLSDWAVDGDALGALDRAGRVALFLEIAAPVAASHRVPVLHKDIKPANVLVDTRDDRRVVRLTDFGSGGLAEPERLALAGIGSLSATLDAPAVDEIARGSFLYLAPELHAGGEASVRSDVFALGVLLWQLVAGDLAKPLAPGWDRSVDDEALCDDIARATDGDPARRFASVDALTDSLCRLDARRAASAASQAEADAIARDRAALARARARRPWIASTVTVLAAALCVCFFYYLHATRSQQALARQVDVVGALNRFLAEDLIGQANPAVAGRANVTVAEAASLASARIDERFATDPERRAALREAMQQAFGELGDLAASIAEGKRAVEAIERLPAADPARRAHALLALSVDLSESHRMDEAKTALDEARAAIASLPQVDPTLAAQSLYAEGYRLEWLYEFERAFVALHEAWSIVERMPATPPGLRQRILLALADTERMSSRLADAGRDATRLHDEQLARWGRDDPRVCYTDVLRAAILQYEERPSEGIALVTPAIACLEARLGPAARRTLTAKSTLGDLQFKREDFASAAATWSRALADASALYGPASPYIVTMRTNIASARQYSGESAAAEAAFAETLAVARRGNPDDAPIVQSLRFRLADSRLDLGRSDGVAALLEGLSPDTLGRAQVAADWDGRLAYERARLALAEGRRDEARVAIEQATTIARRTSADGWFAASRMEAWRRRSGLGPALPDVAVSSR